jgi:hypothetical protein
MIVYLDLDRTLFKTDKLREVWEYIEAQYPMAVGAYDSRETFYYYVDDLYYYDMGGHLASLGLEPQDVYADVAEAGFADGRFEYDGCHELIETLEKHGADIRILTFGADDFQRFKVSLCPSLQGLEVMTTLRSKAELLDELEQECWLVDDKMLGDELPGNVSFVQVNLSGNPQPPTLDWPVKYSLKEVGEFFDAVMR